MATTTKEWLLSGKILDMPVNSERMVNGHHVERFADGWKVDGLGTFGPETALEKVCEPIQSLTLEQAKQMVRNEGFKVSASSHEDGHRIYACSVESVNIGPYGTHPRYEVSFNKETGALLIGQQLRRQT